MHEEKRFHFCSLCLLKGHWRIDLGPGFFRSNHYSHLENMNAPKKIVPNAI